MNAAEYFERAAAQGIGEQYPLPEIRLIARQGHKYSYFGLAVIAMESGSRVKVRQLWPDAPWLGAEMTADAEWLKPLPMKYHGCEVPA